MPRIYDTIKCTTETLDRALNDAAAGGATIDYYQWVGGRDWVVIAYRDPSSPSPATVIRRGEGRS